MSYPRWMEMSRSEVGASNAKNDLRQRFLLDTLAAWDDYQATGLHLTGEEVDAWLAKLEVGEKCVPPEGHL